MDCDTTRRCNRVSAFTLLETLMVVTLVAALAGMVVMLTSGVGQRADEQMVKAECAEIRQAVLRFHADMGEPPRYLAELVQSPEPTGPVGGWWWRTDSTPDARLRSFDPATRRGWNGPYIRGNLVDAAASETGEARLVTASTYERVNSNLAANRQLAIIGSRYSTYPQQMDGTRPVSHYQLDLTDASELAVRFVRDPLASPDQATVIVRLGTGIQP